MESEPLCVVHAPPAEKTGEARTLWVVALTLVMMVAELVVGFWSGSLALQADGWHMLTHVAALGLTAAAYWYARTRAGHQAFAFGTGKVYALAGYTSSAFLFAVSLYMVWEAVVRFIRPEAVAFKEALPIAVLGLLVNLVSAKILEVDPARSHAHHHHHGHGAHDHAHDHNLRAAYLHVVADALTSVLAIVALVCGEWLGVLWLDTVVAIVGSVIIFKWALSLSIECAKSLLDLDPSTGSRDAVRKALEGMGDTKVADLHLWRVGPGRLVCVVAVESRAPRALEEYRNTVIGAVPLTHLTVEVRALA